MYPDNADAEVRRIQLMAEPVTKRRHRAHGPARGTGWVLPTVVLLILIALVASAVLFDHLLAGDSIGPAGVGPLIPEGATGG